MEGAPGYNTIYMISLLFSEPLLYPNFRKLSKVTLITSRTPPPSTVVLIFPRSIITDNINGTRDTRLYDFYLQRR